MSNPYEDYDPKKVASERLIMAMGKTNAKEMEKQFMKDAFEKYGLWLTKSVSGGWDAELHFHHYLNKMTEEDDKKIIKFIVANRITIRKAIVRYVYHGPFGYPLRIKQGYQEGPGGRRHFNEVVLSTQPIKRCGGRSHLESVLIYDSSIDKINIEVFNIETYDGTGDFTNTGIYYKDNIKTNFPRKDMYDVMIYDVLDNFITMKCLKFCKILEVWNYHGPQSSYPLSGCGGATCPNDFNIKLIQSGLEHIIMDKYYNYGPILYNSSSISNYSVNYHLDEKHVKMPVKTTFIEKLCSDSERIAKYVFN